MHLLFFHRLSFLTNYKALRYGQSYQRENELILRKSHDQGVTLSFKGIEEGTTSKSVDSLTCVYNQTKLLAVHATFWAKP